MRRQGVILYLLPAGALPGASHKPANAIRPDESKREMTMGINTPSDIEAELSIGATDQKMVRVFITTEAQEIPMDFLPEEAEEIARELMAAAAACRG